MSEARTTASLSETARRVLPGGGFGNVPFDIVIDRGKAGRVWDTDGKEYVDYLIGSGPMLVGHAHPEVTQVVEDQIRNGTTFFANNAHGIRLAEAIVDAVACADKVRFVSSGSEATFYAMRLARTYRKRDKILKFEGGFHGMSDYALMSMAPKQPGNFPQAAPDTPGIPQRVREEMLIAPFNDAETAVALIREHADDLAGVIVEPFQRLIPPKPGFLEALRAITAELGIVLIFDEVVTGFRFAYGGAQERYGVVPDVCSLGKIIGGGFPLAAIAGRDNIMAHFDGQAVGPDDFMQQIGTLSGNPVAAAAGLKTLEILKRPGTYETLFESGERLMRGFEEILRSAGHTAQSIGEPPMFDIIFADGDIADYRATMRGDGAKMARLNSLLLERGILKSASKVYVSCAHDENDIQFTLDAYRDAVAAL